MAGQCSAVSIEFRSIHKRSVCLDGGQAVTLMAMAICLMALGVKGNMAAVVLSLWHMMFRSTQAQTNQHYVHHTSLRGTTFTQQQEAVSSVPQQIQWTAVAAGGQQQLRGPRSAAASVGRITSSRPRSQQWKPAVSSEQSTNRQSALQQTRRQQQQEHRGGPLPDPHPANTVTLITRCYSSTVGWSAKPTTTPCTTPRRSSQHDGKHAWGWAVSIEVSIHQHTRRICA